MNSKNRNIDKRRRRNLMVDTRKHDNDDDDGGDGGVFVREYLLSSSSSLSSSSRLRRRDEIGEEVGCISCCLTSVAFWLFFLFSLISSEIVEMIGSMLLSYNGNIIVLYCC